MIKVIWDQGFKRSYKRKVKNNNEYKKKFWNILEIFAKDPFYPQLKTHISVFGNLSKIFQIGE